MKITTEQAHKLFDVLKEIYRTFNCSSPYGELLIKEIETNNKPKEIWVCDFCGTKSTTNPQDFHPAMNAYCSARACTLIDMGSTHKYTQYIEKEEK